MWQDWMNVLFGLWLAVSPWFLLTFIREPPEMVTNCLISGLLIASFGTWAAFAKGQRWQRWVLILLGIWMLVAPGTLRYSVPTITWDNVIVGLTVGILALWALGEQQNRVQL